MTYNLFFANLRNVVADPSLPITFLLRQYKKRFLWESRFKGIREPKVRSEIDLSQKEISNIATQLKEAGINVSDLAIDKSDFERYLAQARYNRFPRYQKGGRNPPFIEKALEHFLAARLLDLSQAGTYIDIANDRSPVPEIYHDLYGCKSYKQDLQFKPGIHCNVIGGDAAHMPVPDGFATHMGLHCSFEHFEGDSDIGFIREAGRVLSPGGRLCILPLYLFTSYVILSDPCVVPRRGMNFENDATIYCVKDYFNRHGRTYDVDHFIKRIVRNLGPLRLTVFTIPDAESISSICHIRFAALFEKPTDS